MTIARLVTAITVAAAGCGAPGPAPQREAPPRASASPPAPVQSASPAASSVGEPAEPAAEAPVAAACPEGPPPAATPPEPRTATEGDGAWTRLGTSGDGERAAEGEALLYRSVIHPHPASRFVSVTLAAIDLCRARIGFVPGTEDKPEVALSGRGLVPVADQPALVAVFNGGWKPEHGRWGMYQGGVSVVPAKEGACTIGIDADGKVQMSSGAPSTELVAYRQTPPCLFEGGTLHPRLARGDEGPWGGKAKDVVTRRRSAIGISADQRFLIYAVGEEAGPRLLAKALMVAGATTGAELDINWYWTRFLLFGTKEGPLGVTSTLIPGMEFQKQGYVEKPSGRDFFYVLRRKR